MTTHGPNVQKLIAKRAAQIIIPDGGGFFDGLAVFSEPVRLQVSLIQATRWVEEVLRGVKAARENPWGEDDEKIAGAVLERIEQQRLAQFRERRKKRKRPNV